MRGMLELRNLDVEIAGKSVCRSLCLSLDSGQRWAMLGSNGIGKTTLLHTLAGLRPAAGGQVLLNGKSLPATQPRARARRIGVLFQDNDDPFPTTVMETALIGRHPHLGPLARESRGDLALAVHALRDVHLAELSRRSVTTLSGGERQRLAVATLLTQDPQVWLLDEPISHLDLHHQIGMLNLLQDRLAHNGGTALMTLHDVNLAARFCDHLLLLFGDGETQHGATEDVLCVNNLERLYGHPIECLSDGDRQVFLPG
ncbi:MAG: ABC transporter ATP-binding protein [Gammaproteobacteria bacterium]|nr:ABC transporter ATP-binding protein [Gammaproteobacteria bacterium]